MMKHTILPVLAIVLLAGCSALKSNKTVADNTLTSNEKSAGWQLLFDGKTPSGWRAFNGAAFPTGWSIENGTLKSSGTAHGDTGGDIVYGVQTFENFELSIDWKLSPGGNSGIFYHALEGSKYKAPYETAPEYQLIDDTGFPEKLEDWQKVGADYAMYTPEPGKIVKPAGEWNNSRILFTPEKVEYYLNGKRTVHFVPFGEDWTTRRNSGKWENFPDYGKARVGYIALQDHGSPVWFKNIKIRKL